jgi:aminopeptidase
MDANASRVGELGIGTNNAIKKLTGGILFDEKARVHIAFGDGYGELTGIKGRESVTHNDALLTSPTVVVDGRVIMRNGKNLL